MEDNKKMNSEHKIILDGRKNAIIEGVIETLHFDDTEICVLTSMGKLTLEGEEMKINEFSENSGKMTVTGNISAFYYIGNSDAKRGLFGRKK